MRAHLTRLIVLSFLLLALPLSTIAQDATPPVELDLSTEAGLLAYQQAQTRVTAADVGLPEGFQLELVAGGLSFPDAVAVAEDGTVFAALSGFGGTPAQVAVVNPDGTLTPVVDAATAGLTPPITDIAFGPDGTFYVAYAGGIAVVDLAAGAVTPIVTGLPSVGDHQNNQLAFAEDGWVYFGQGTATNSMVVGPDNALFGWLPLYPDFSDVPCEDVIIAADPYESPNVLTADNPNDLALTSPYQPFGVAVDPGTTIPGAVLCNGSVLRFQAADPSGTLEVFAWGMRNPYGLAADASGALWVVDNGPDARGSRPIQNAPDSVWRLEEEDAGRWFGYPDYVAGTPVTDEAFAPEGGEPPEFAIANHDALLNGGEAPVPVATLAPHTATGQAAVAPEAWGDLAGSLFIASHGDFGPVSGATERSGHAVYRIEQETGGVETFLQNPHPHEPTGAPARPVGIAFAPDGSLYVADLGIIEASPAGLVPRPNTGAIWRIMPEGPVGTPAPDETAVTPDAEAASPVTQTAGTVEVTETEFAIDMPTELPAGPTTFVVTNAGTAEHNFEVEGQGIEEAFEQNLQPGETRELQVNLEPGTYEVYCPVGDHEDRGMRLELTVTGS
ncbi:MAG TPA: cupredoxin domain-containing protein [Thermomicrobiales bacterium]|nr:cupredoxin domain-containing protein [Thermomicrobiales bacterium]